MKNNKETLELINNDLLGCDYKYRDLLKRIEALENNKDVCNIGYMTKSYIIDGKVIVVDKSTVKTFSNFHKL